MTGESPVGPGAKRGGELHTGELETGAGMITIGIGAHKQIHMAVALNAAGQVIAQWRGANTVPGWEDLAHWAAAQGQPRQWGSAGAWSYGRGLAQHLVKQGETVYDITPRWTAMQRGRARN